MELCCVALVLMFYWLRNLNKLQENSLKKQIVKLSTTHLITIVLYRKFLGQKSVCQLRVSDTKLGCRIHIMYYITFAYITYYILIQNSDRTTKLHISSVAY